MSEHDSDSSGGGGASRGGGAESQGGGSGRKGFVRDVMRRITPAGGRPSDEGDLDAGSNPGIDPPRERPASEAERLQDAMQFFGSDSSEFRHRLERMLADFHARSIGGLVDERVALGERARRDEDREAHEGRAGQRIPSR